MADELERQRDDLQQRLDAERERTEAAYKEAQELKEQLLKAQTAAPPKVQPIYMTATRKLDRFRGKPNTDADCTVQEWVDDVRLQMAARQLDAASQAAFVMDNLAGNARQEILGRGDDVKKDATKIFTVLLKVFGDGDSLPTLQQKFFSCQQSEKEDLLSVSLRLVELYDRICRLDANYKPNKESTLKSRLAEVVKEDTLKREIRRLNIESPDMNFFEMRDRAIEWLGHGPPPTTQRRATAQEVGTEDVMALLIRQGEQLEKQQKQIEELLQNSKKRHNGPRKETKDQDKTPRACYRCQSLDHLIRDCPQPKPSNSNTSGKGDSAAGTAADPKSTTRDF